MASHNTDYVIVSREGLIHPKAKTLVCFTTREEAGEAGKKLFGKFNFQILTFIEFRRTHAYVTFMRKLQIIQRLADAKQNYALSQKYRGPTKAAR